MVIFKSNIRKYCRAFQEEHPYRIPLFFVMLLFKKFLLPLILIYWISTQAMLSLNMFIYSFLILFCLKCMLMYPLYQKFTVKEWQDLFKEICLFSVLLFSKWLTVFQVVMPLYHIMLHQYAESSIMLIKLTCFSMGWITQSIFLGLIVRFAYGFHEHRIDIIHADSFQMLLVLKGLIVMFVMVPLYHSVSLAVFLPLCALAMIATFTVMMPLVWYVMFRIACPIAGVKSELVRATTLKQHEENPEKITTDTVPLTSAVAARNLLQVEDETTQRRPSGPSTALPSNQSIYETDLFKGFQT